MHRKIFIVFFISFLAMTEVIYGQIDTTGFGMKERLLMSAIINRDSVSVEWLISQGADVNAKYFLTGDEKSPPLLTLACSTDRTGKIVSILLKAGANVNDTNSSGGTPLMSACSERRNTDIIISELLKAGANPNARNKFGLTALMNASEMGKVNAVKMLIQAGATVNEQTKTGETALWKAVEDGNSEIVSLLLKAGANSNAANEDGITVLMNATSHFRTRNSRKSILDSENINTIRILLNSGANVNSKDKHGRTALWLTEERLKDEIEHEKIQDVILLRKQIIQILKEHGAK